MVGKGFGKGKGQYDAEGAPEPAFGFPPESLEAAFVEQNNLDRNGVMLLMGLGEEARRRVMAEGPLSGNSPNAVLMARLRRAQAEAGSGGW